MPLPPAPALVDTKDVVIVDDDDGDDDEVAGNIVAVLVDSFSALSFASSSSELSDSIKMKLEEMGDLEEAIHAEGGGGEGGEGEDATEVELIFIRSRCPSSTVVPPWPVPLSALHSSALLLYASSNGRNRSGEEEGEEGVIAAVVAH